jgi:hypothetical protein
VAKATVDFAGFMRGLKPPPPSGASSSAASSVVPQMAHADSSFSRSGRGKKPKKETQGLKPTIFLPNFRHD